MLNKKLIKHLNNIVLIYSILFFTNNIIARFRVTSLVKDDVIEEQSSNVADKETEDLSLDTIGEETEEDSVEENVELDLKKDNQIQKKKSMTI